MCAWNNNYSFIFLRRFLSKFPTYLLRQNLVQKAIDLIKCWSQITADNLMTIADRFIVRYIEYFLDKPSWYVIGGWLSPLYKGDPVWLLWSVNWVVRSQPMACVLVTYYWPVFHVPVTPDEYGLNIYIYKRVKTTLYIDLIFFVKYIYIYYPIYRSYLLCCYDY